MRTLANRGSGVKDLAAVCKLVPFSLFQYVLQMLSMVDVNCFSSCTICATEYNMGWH